MSQQDREILRRLSLNQAELARHLRTSRQAVNAGIQQIERFLDANRLMRVHEAFHAARDPRAKLTAEMLKVEHGIDVESDAPGTIPRDPDSHAGHKEFWIFAHRPLEIEDGLYAHSMRFHFRSPDKWIIYFVADEDTGKRLAQRLGHELRALRKDGAQTARIYILECNAVVLLPHCAFFDPRDDVRGYVKNISGSFTEMDYHDAVRIVTMVFTAGIRTEADTVLPPAAEGKATLYNGLSFRVLHEL